MTGGSNPEVPYLHAPILEVRDGNIRVTTDRQSFQMEVIHGFLSSSYWAEQIPLEVVERCIRCSWCFAVFDGDRQVGFARVITDFATYAYIADVFILESHRGRGLSKFLMKTIREAPPLQNLRRWNLLTKDAHGLYEQFGFKRAAEPERYMEITDRELYKRGR